MSTRTQTVSYRPEIDGLRALAVIAVILFHAKIALSGGYVGVDIFFVISGYLITSLIVKDLQEGTFTFTAFLERRIRRIVPAMSVVVIAVLVAGWFLIMPEDYVSLGMSAMALAAVVANIYFWRNTSGYFANTEEMPLLHTWSLAVEEQFYLIMPLFLVIAFRLAAPRLLLPVVIVSMLGSLAASAYAVAVFPLLFAFASLGASHRVYPCSDSSALDSAQSARSRNHNVRRSRVHCCGLPILH